MFVRFQLVAVTLDLPARAMVMNMKQYNGKFGCCYCEDEGSNPPGQATHRYYPCIETSVPRQHGSILECARQAATARQANNKSDAVGTLLFFVLHNIYSIIK